MSRTVAVELTLRSDPRSVNLRMAGHPEEAIPILERRLEIPNQTQTVQTELEAARAAAGE